MYIFVPAYSFVSPSNCSINFILTCVVMTESWDFPLAAKFDIFW